MGTITTLNAIHDKPKGHGTSFPPFDGTRFDHTQWIGLNLFPYSNCPPGSPNPWKEFCPNPPGPMPEASDYNEEEWDAFTNEYFDKVNDLRDLHRLQRDILINQQQAAGINSFLKPLTKPDDVLTVDLEQMLEDIYKDTDNLYGSCNIQTHSFAPFTQYDITQCQGIMAGVWHLISDTYWDIVEIDSPPTKNFPGWNQVLPEKGVPLDKPKMSQEERLLREKLSSNVNLIVNQAMEIVDAAYEKEIARFDEQATADLEEMQIEFSQTRNCRNYHQWEQNNPAPVIPDAMSQPRIIET